MDASTSIDLQFPDKILQFSWDIDFDGNYETFWSNVPTIECVFEKEIPYQVGLKVRNYLGLMNDTIQIVDVGHKNQNPKAFYYVTTNSGNISTNFRFDLWSSRDYETPPSKLLTRWDWENDGKWDTEFSTNKHIYHKFEAPGVYPVKVEVVDEGGLSDTYSSEIFISDQSFETDILLDKRSLHAYQYYGIVKIGKKWWFARNLNVQNDRVYQQLFYDNEFDLCETYGSLYSPERGDKLCPDGWKIPSKEDWEDLFRHIPEDTFAELQASGNSGFGAVFGGMANSSTNPTTFYGKDSWAHYISSTQPTGSISYWIVSLDKKNERMITGYQFGRNKYSVRCVKE